MGAVLVTCPRCRREVPVGTVRGWLWWRRCTCCDNPVEAMLYDFVIGKGVVGARERAAMINRANDKLRKNQ